jgi:hypothetical protein
VRRHDLQVALEVSESPSYGRKRCGAGALHQHPWTADVSSGIEQIFDKIAEAAGLGEDVVVTPHKLRHTFARTWLERGGEVYSLSRLMGHSSVKITEIYLEDFRSQQARAQHTQFSPVSKMRVRQRGHGHHIYQCGPRSGGEKARKDTTETDTEE